MSLLRCCLLMLLPLAVLATAGGSPLVRRHVGLAYRGYGYPSRYRYRTTYGAGYSYGHGYPYGYRYSYGPRYWSGAGYPYSSGYHYGSPYRSGWSRRRSRFPRSHPRDARHETLHEHEHPLEDEDIESEEPQSEPEPVAVPQLEDVEEASENQVFNEGDEE
ncbi:uncharacterized protein LOC119092310 [Pollicipes pollicipes]|uniref:uncharacterized protein LOC119092310 n=1 Tax=Pollicipes pollicipes TaxID=41117 RepID=UPI00188583B3|nr:uncharacterized protein LOC119092310 [Pollicipes pollicipes]